MKRCPENDKILLFCEHELSEVERAQFELHIQTCSECREEVKQISSDDSLLREGVEEAFSRHRVTSRIMQQIRSEKIEPLPANNQRGWRYFWLTAFALLTVFAVASLYMPAAVKYHGRATGVMIQALTDNSTLQGAHLAADQTFDLAAFEPAALDGCFLFTVTADQTSVFKISGSTGIRRSEGLLEFFDTTATFELISGARLTIIVNGKRQQLERKTVFSTTAAAIDDLQPDAVSLAGLDRPLTASTTAEADAIITSDEADTASSADQAELASITTGLSAEAGTGSDSLIDQTPGSGKNPFADEPLDLNGN
ncbi:MAG: hypothetical protein CVV41_05235 [Candidatus Riflebacteria bacterium HGW-Riflebacteria-1]|jgi:hypothetical protein|nr:MAG: hypothetical protein CVV41_05235 [Candidatus Riflebacteria bacterium HGW-Riflebacteria-1]